MTGQTADDESDLKDVEVLQAEATVCHLCQHPDLTYLLRPGELKPGITAWHVISFQTSFAPGTAQLLITGCGAVRRQNFQNWCCWWLWWPPRPPLSPAPRNESGHTVQGHDSEQKKNIDSDVVYGPFFTFACVFWQSRAELDAGAPPYQSSCICPTPQESSRSVT